MTVSILTPDVCERDVDLLLLEEFVASNLFCKWFLKQLGINDNSKLISAMCSVKTPKGESDIELTFRSANGLLKVMIENKIYAIFQHNQSRRYLQRAKDYVKTGKYSAVVTVLVAPQVYFGGEDDDFEFDVKVIYESILDWFKSADNLGSRQSYKVKLLSDAIDRGRSGWKPIPDQKVMMFWRSYRNLAEQIAPILRMPAPKKEIPRGSNFIRFRPVNLPPELSLLHKVNYCNVDLQFPGMGNRLADMERIYRNYLIRPMQIEKAAQSAAIRIRVDKIDMTAPFQKNERAVKKGIEAALKLYDWYCQLKIDNKVPRR